MKFRIEQINSRSFQGNDGASVPVKEFLVKVAGQDETAVVEAFGAQASKVPADWAVGSIIEVVAPMSCEQSGTVGGGDFKGKAKYKLRFAPAAGGGRGSYGGGGGKAPATEIPADDYLALQKQVFAGWVDYLTEILDPRAYGEIVQTAGSQTSGYMIAANLRPTGTPSVSTKAPVGEEGF